MQVSLHAKCVCVLQYIYLHVMVTFTSTFRAFNGCTPFLMLLHFLAKENISHDVQ